MPLLPRAWFSNPIASDFLTGLRLVVMAISGRRVSGFESWKGVLWKPRTLVYMVLSFSVSRKCGLPGGPHGSVFASCFTTGGPLFRWTPRAGEGSAGEKTSGELHYPLLIH